MKKNPFEVNTPEGISAQDAYDLFVDVFSDFYQVPRIGHTFLNGSRGSGKSMMFRYMMPDCQILKGKKALNELDYFALYVPIKLTDINYPELEKLKTNAVTYFNEHLLTSYIATKSFHSLLEYEAELNDSIIEIDRFYNEIFLWYVEVAGHDISKYKNKFDKGVFYIEEIIKILDRMFLECNKYCKDIILERDNLTAYNKSLCTYINFLYPILLELKKLPFIPQDKPIYILIDDAGYLNKIQTEILNTWVSYRTSHNVSLKISTQFDYKSYKTVTNKTIDAPHDYSLVDINSIYTSNKDNYFKRIDDIVQRRLNKYLSIETTTSNFFPPYQKQTDAIEKIASELKAKHHDPEKSYAGNDAARRYASSEFLKDLIRRRSSTNYSYAGFDNLVAISSGIVRHFLEPASKMFANMLAQGVENISHIPPSTQDEVIKDFSESFLSSEFDKIRDTFGNITNGERLSKADKLHNLITGLGGLFHSIFISDKSERIVFSVAITDIPSNELREILHLAVQYGYLHQGSIRNKQGTGKCVLYILSRTLAPVFQIEPKGFKGYQFMNSDTLQISLYDPQKFIKAVAPTTVMANSYGQLSIF
ncbi:ORC-CDC6 family AAA ATPase [Dysgonomonas reticulitermitis]